MPLDDRQYFTVTELNAQVRTLIEGNYPEVAVIGEVSNFKRHTSGHLYFTLKDPDAQLRAVCFRGNAARIRFDIEDGLQVLVTGRITVYEPYGQYQLIAYAVEEAGVGRLERAFRELCERLEKEGLFEADHKKSLPRYPFRIAVVTSPTGAAVQDIVSTLRRRWPAAQVLLVPVAVQGERAAPEIVRALERLADVEDLDVAIVGRGGGSLEDLWAFNEEAVARAIFECPVPVISAVGHETDYTISDFVADVRAATPTMAAEIAVPRVDDVRAGLDERQKRLLQHVETGLELRRRRLSEMLRSYGLGRVGAEVERSMQTLDFAMERLYGRVREVVRDRGSRVNEVLARLEGLDVNKILSRGYTICLDAKTGGIIRSSRSALDARDVQLTFCDGKVRAEVKERADGA